MARMRVTKEQLDGYIAFLDELDYILDQLYDLLPRRNVELENLRLFMYHIEKTKWLNQMDSDPYKWKVLSMYTMIPQSHLIWTIRSTKFVQYKDFSLRNFILPHIWLDEALVRSKVIDLPGHVDLKQFWVPEQLILKERQDTIYYADWLN